MTQIGIARIANAGFESLRVSSDLIELTIIPDLGGKISSLRDLRTGREWLWRHPRLGYKRVPHGSSYVDSADTGGWDECFPTVLPCAYPSEPWMGVSIDDHGELWSQIPEFEVNQQLQSVRLCTRWQGISLPYTFTRTIVLVAQSARLQVDYAVQNNAAQPLNFIWCIHPLLAIEPGMQLRLPPSACFHVNGTFPENLLSSNSVLRYPFSMPGLNFPSIPESSAARSMKIWSDPLPADEGWAALAAQNGELRMTWDTAALPQVAVWMNFGAWAGDGGAPYFNLGLEPCIGAQDSLAEAVTGGGPYATLPPRGSKTWSLEFELLA